MPKDKILHIIAGFVLALPFGLLHAPVVGFLAATVAGVAKEAWDDFSKRGTSDWVDTVATIAGGLAGALTGFGLYTLMDH